MALDRISAGGIVLCGGQSKRMGRPKAWLPFGSETMLERVVRLMSEVVDLIVVVAAPDQEVPPLHEGVLLTRDEEKGKGPLQGLSAGLRALSGKVDAAYLSSCDVPLLRPAFVRRVLDLLGDHAICVPYVDGFHHPMAAVYRVGILDQVDRLLAENRLRPIFLFETVPTRLAESHELLDIDPTLQSLRNLNTPEDYQQALSDFKS
ncbi:MAG TPA: molybdenum cofactor guanylyltransferase, partial [Gemmataceae bacterium]|nr:molybdenum cofactor guanylyltransferase [Gemmataceae bacterium]